jgi:mevalonate kinase
MELELEIPSKTFIAGEYLALEGGPALIANTEPSFKLRVKEKPTETNPFHPESPAGQLWSKNKSFFSKYSFNFEDPHSGKGGFGASTAQFAFLHALFQMQDSAWTEAPIEIDIHQTWADYREICSNSGILPSGADLIAQLTGGLTFFDRSMGRVEMYHWPFTNLNMILIRTDKKIATHEHLKIRPQFESDGFRSAMALIETGLSKIDSELFIEGVLAFSKELNKFGLVAESTKDLLKQLSEVPVAAAKGCGAMGADVIALFCESEELETVKAFLNLKKLEVVATSNDLSKGFRKRVQGGK